jgi:hypothetical protein
MREQRREHKCRHTHRARGISQLRQSHPFLRRAARAVASRPAARSSAVVTARALLAVRCLRFHSRQRRINRRLHHYRSLIHRLLKFQRQLH